MAFLNNDGGCEKTKEVSLDNSAVEKVDMKIPDSSNFIENPPIQTPSQEIKSAETKPLEFAKHLKEFQIGENKENSVPVLFFERSGTEIVDFYFTFRGAGSAYAPNSALPYFVSKILSYGKEGQLRKDFEDALNNKGIIFDLSYNSDDMQIYLRTLRGNLSEALELIFDMLEKPNLSKTNLDLARQESISYADHLHMGPDYLAQFHFESELFKGTLYEPTEITSLAANSIQEIEVNEFFKKINQCNLEVSAVGDLTAENMHDLLEPNFQKISKGCETIPKDSKKIEPNFFSDTRSFSGPTKSAQKLIYFSQKSIDITNDYHLALSIIYDKIGGFSLHSELNDILREQKGLTYGAYASLKSRRDCNYAAGLVKTGYEDTNHVVDEVKAIFASYKNGRFSEDDLRYAKTRARGKLSISMSDNLSILALVNTMQKFNLEKDFYDKVAKRIDDISIDEIKNIVEQNFDPDKMSFVVFS